MSATDQSALTGFLKKTDLFISTTICAVYLLICPVSAQEGISVTAEVDRTAISSNDQLTLTVTVAGDAQQVGEPQLPLLSGFNIVGSSRSSQFSMINGVVTARTAFTYRLQPTDSGTFTIDPITIVVNGSAYQTDPIVVQVAQGAAPTPSPEPTSAQPPPPAPGGLAGQDFYVEADVDYSKPFVGQQIIYRFRFYQSTNLFNQPRLDWPPFSGFWSEALTPNRVFEQSVAGRLYRVTEVRQALFPTAPGQVAIQPSILTIPGDFFSRDVVLQTGSVGVDVQPLPDGAPDGFNGAVGQYEILAWAEPTEVQVNEPVTLFLRVWGTGNLTTLADPTEEAKAQLSAWRIYEPQVTINVGQDGDAIQGEKQFERLLVPRQEGQLNIPPFALVYFDPANREYRRIQTEPLMIQVTPGDTLAPGPIGEGKQDVTVLASDIRHIKPAPPSLPMHHTNLIEQPLYWLGWILPGLGAAGVLVWERQRRRLTSDIAYARAQRARRIAYKQLSKARKQARQDKDAVYATVSRSLTNYLGDKFNLSSAGLTRDAIRKTLAAQAVPYELIDRALICLDWADSGRFAPVAAGRGAAELVTETEAIISELEQYIHNI